MLRVSGRPGRLHGHAPGRWLAGLEESHLCIFCILISHSRHWLFIFHLLMWLDLLGRPHFQASVSGKPFCHLISLRVERGCCKPQEARARLTLPHPFHCLLAFSSHQVLLPGNTNICRLLPQSRFSFPTQFLQTTHNYGAPTLCWGISQGPAQKRF